MKMPRCTKCETIVTVCTGLPVWVHFSEDGVANIVVDTDELADINDDSIHCSCETGVATLDAADLDIVNAALIYLGQHYAPSVDADLPETLEV